MDEKGSCLNCGSNTHRGCVSAIPPPKESPALDKPTTVPKEVFNRVMIEVNDLWIDKEKNPDCYTTKAKGCILRARNAYAEYLLKGSDHG